MYVAMTRAKDVLNVSSTADKKTSPFVYEAALVDDVAKPKEGERGFW
jgi:superfamily I DNA/RNA helicase